MEGICTLRKSYVCARRFDYRRIIEGDTYTIFYTILSRCIRAPMIRAPPNFCFTTILTNICISQYWKSIVYTGECPSGATLPEKASRIRYPFGLCKVVSLFVCVALKRADCEPESHVRPLGVLKRANWNVMLFLVIDVTSKEDWPVQALRKAP